MSLSEATRLFGRCRFLSGMANGKKVMSVKVGRKLFQLTKMLDDEECSHEFH